MEEPSSRDPVPQSTPSPPSRSPEDAVRAVATAGTLLVALDFDGTLAPLVDDRMAAAPLPAAVAALHRLAALPRTALALVSGRDLRELAAVSRAPAGTTLVGSHGGEWARPGVPVEQEPIGDAARAELAAARAALGTLVAGTAAFVEDKVATTVLHTRRCPPDVAAALAARARDLPAAHGWAAVHVLVGKDVVELAVREPDKAAAVRRLAAEADADAVVFAGDDVSDESVFRAWAGQSSALMVKVGAGPTAAGLRLAGPADVAALLAALADYRARPRTP
ncbi:MAG: trehalose-phosphatase [Kineosporiaceae bacterium]